jgi:CRP-like cAMP-binding protein
MKAKRVVRVDQLRRLPLFEGCDDHELARVARRADEIAVPPGYVLVHEGDWTDEVFIILDGEADVIVGGRSVARLGSDEVVGEMAAMDGQARAATVAAATSLRLLVLDSDSFRELLDQFPLIARRVVNGLSYRLRATQARPA